MRLDEIIECENESTYVDFKAIEYVKDKYEDLLKDIIAMANCDITDPRYIIIGVKLKDDGTRAYLGIDKLTDSAIFQKLVSDKIEPDLSIEYNPYKFKNVRLGILIIKSTIDQPYVIKNQYKTLVPGDSFIRIGTHQRRLTRKDLDKIYKSKFDKNTFEGEVQLSFSKSDTDILELEGRKNLQFPSDLARKKILKAIQKREDEQKEDSKWANKLYRLPRFNSILSNVPYEQRSLEELRGNLENVEKTYYKDDCYYYFEEISYSLNFSIHNYSEKYIEDCSIEFRIDNTAFLRISDKVYEKPVDDEPFGISSVKVPSYAQMNYPKVEVSGEKYIINQHLGDLKHKIPTNVFNEPLRIVPIRGLEINSVNIEATIYGRNIRTPIERKFIIRIK